MKIKLLMVSRKYINYTHKYELNLVFIDQIAEKCTCINQSDLNFYKNMYQQRAKKKKNLGKE